MRTEAQITQDRFSYALLVRKYADKYAAPKEGGVGLSVHNGRKWVRKFTPDDEIDRVLNDLYGTDRR